MFDSSAADFNSHSVVAIDEATTWELASLTVGASELEREALARGKKLVLVTQGRDDLSLLNIQFHTEPMLPGQDELLDVSLGSHFIALRRYAPQQHLSGDL